MKRALVIYSGGMDTTVCLGLLKEEGYGDIHAVTVDVGQSSDDIANAEERAATLSVTSTSNAGPGSLRDAVLNATSGDTIVFDCSVVGTI